MKTRYKVLRFAGGMLLGAIGFLLVMSLFMLASCSSATKDIASAANAANKDAHGIVQHANDAIAEVDSPPDEVPVTPEVLGWLGSIKSHLVAIVAGGERVKSTSARIIERVPDVENRTPWWAALLKLALWVAALAGVVWLLATTGIGRAIKTFVWGLGFLIPQQAKTSAKFDYEYLQTNQHDTDRRESIAARRAGDPAYNAAYTRLNREGKL